MELVREGEELVDQLPSHMELVREGGELVAQLPSHFPFRVVTRGEKGRALVTTRCSQPLTRVFIQNPLAVGEPPAGVPSLSRSPLSAEAPLPRESPLVNTGLLLL